ncbi:MAG: DUF1150 family protein [Alphaproteobacteria bacterium]
MMTLAQLRSMNPKDFAALGMPGLAYVRRVATDGTVVWIIHAADGTQLGIAPSHELAVAAIRQNDLEPISLH